MTRHPYLMEVSATATLRGVRVRWVSSGRVSRRSRAVYRLRTHVYQIVVGMRGGHLASVELVDDRSGFRRELEWPVSWYAGVLTLLMPPSWQGVLQTCGYLAEMEIDGVNMGRLTGPEVFVG